MTLLDRSEVQTALESLNMQVHSINLVSQSQGGGKEVYRAEVRTKSGEQVVFAKGYPEHVRENLVRVVSDQRDVGLPDSHVVSNDRTILITEKAVGRPLSWLFPILVIPGIWYSKQDNLEDAMYELGRSLGHLHGIQIGPERSLHQAGTEDSTAFNIPRAAAEKYDEATISRIEELFDEAKQASSPLGICHSDPSPHNIYYSKGNVRLIDFGFQFKPVVTDRALAELGIQLMIGRLPYGRSNQQASLVAAFRRGHREISLQHEVARSTLSALKLGICLRLLERYSTQSKTYRATITRWTDRPVIDRLVDKYLEVGLRDLKN